MLHSILLTLAPSLAAVPVVPVPVLSEHGPTLSGDEELEAKLKEIGDDVAKLVELAEKYAKDERETEERVVLARILELDPEHEGAHEKLRHHRYDGRWFETYAALSAYRREEAKRMLDEHGLVRFGEEWVTPKDLPFLRMSWVKDASGSWLSPAAAAEKERAAEKLVAKGWQQQDLTWVSPDEFDKWRQGLWKCGEEWLADEAANEYHARIDRPWEVTSKYFDVASTCDRETVQWVGWYADLTFPDLVRTFGVKPASKPLVVTVRGLDQYNALAGGDQELGLQPNEASGFSSFHYAYFAEAWFDLNSTPPEYKGCGVAYWDKSDESLTAYGQHAIRHAAAQSFIEGIDPSWDTISKLVSGAGAAFPPDAFWSEKKIPLWLRYGAASYVERYFRDPNVGDGGNPWWARDWALENLRQKGGLRELEELFAFGLDVNELENSNRLINEAGLVVAFVLDGDCKPVDQKHQAFKAALKRGEDTKAAAEELQQAILKNQRALEKFAKL